MTKTIAVTGPMDMMQTKTNFIHFVDFQTFLDIQNWTVTFDT